MNPNPTEPDDDRIRRMKNDDGIRDREFRGRYMLYDANNARASIAANEDDTVHVEDMV